MNLEGHIGLSLTITFGILYLLRISGQYYLTLAFLIVVLSSLPDIDLRLEIAHRKYTHNILSSIIFGLIFGAIFYYTDIGFLGGFIGGFGGSFLHILGDIMTYMPFPAFFPIKRGRIALGLFRSNNMIVNKFFLILGVLILSIYFIKIYFA